MPALFVGFMLFCGFFFKIPSDVTINGVSVGGMSRGGAVSLVREKIEEELKNKKLTVVGRRKNYVFTYPEIGYKDDLQKLITTVKKHGSYTAVVSYYLNGINEIVSAISESESTPASEPYAIFNAYGTPFTYNAGYDGVQVDAAALNSAILKSLSGSCRAKMLPSFFRK